MTKNNQTTRSNCREGQRFEGYQLVELLAAGAHSEVWSAISVQGEICVLKLFLPEESDEARKEYATAVSFTHPNILSPIALLSDEARCAMVLPYCKGRSVDAVVGHMNEGLLWQLVRDVSGALDKIHSQGWMHLSVNPSNILWDGTSFLLADYGACAAADAERDAVATGGGAYQYDAPERFSKASCACDVWSLGATVFHLYMGCHVFNGLGGSVQQPHSPLPYMRKSMPALSELVMGCLAYNPSERPLPSVLYERACEEMRKRPMFQKSRPKKQDAQTSATTRNSTFWPDDMIDNQ